jgi:hypothetical protein
MARKLITPDKAHADLRRIADDEIKSSTDSYTMMVLRAHVDTYHEDKSINDDALAKIIVDAKQALHHKLSSIPQATIVTQANSEIKGALDLMAQPGMVKALNELASQYAEKEKASKNWRDYFRSIDQLEDGGIRFLIDGLFPEGTTFIGALPGAGKTWLGLSIAKALVTGNAFLGRYKVPERVPVLYLIPEASSRSFKKRIKQLDIPTDPNYFLCRTISEGNTLMLDNPIILEATKAMKPVIFLDTAIRFSTATDENAASQNKKLVDDIISLRAAGAVGVFAFHHATKSSSKEQMTMENTLRGTGDYAAMCDAAYGIQINQSLYDNGRGPLEILVVCTKPRDISPQPKPFTLISTLVGEGGKIVDVLAREKDFLIKDEGEVAEEISAAITKILIKDPEIDVRNLADILTNDYGYKTSKSAVDRQLQKGDYHKKGPRGPNGKPIWVCGTIELINLATKTESEQDEVVENVKKAQEELSF